MKVLKDFGTRPKAIQMGSLAYTLAVKRFFDLKVCITAQYRETLEAALELTDITTHHDFNIVKAAQISRQVIGRILLVDMRGIE